jgi:hypothetical protein
MWRHVDLVWVDDPPKRWFTQNIQGTTTQKTAFFEKDDDYNCNKNDLFEMAASHVNEDCEHVRTRAIMLELWNERPMNEVATVTNCSPNVNIDISSLVSWGGLRLLPLGSSAANWFILPAPVERWWVGSSRWNENWQGKPKYSQKTCPSATLSTTNPEWSDLGSNTGRRDGKPATNHPSYGMAFSIIRLTCFSSWQTQS